ncbi:hypothetical protein M8J75_014917 [Diaphorina citri]|nr:hypothetical protein M8J75_014917 [Diaphorina citri]KAI5725969.1 hypothetical protein M8J77_022324 [Diaphorina citri]
MSSDSDSDNSNFVDNLAFKIDEHLWEIRIGLCTVAVLAFGYAVKSVKPFTKFSHINQIPPSFIENNIKLNGKVVDLKQIPSPVNVDSNPPVPLHRVSILVDHCPIFNPPFSTSKVDPLAICLDSVAVSKQGLTTMERILLDRPIGFVLLSAEQTDSHLSCIVYCRLPPTSVWTSLFARPLNLAAHLVSSGLGAVTPSDPSLTLKASYRRHYQGLLAAEARAMKDQVGMWNDGNGQDEETESLWTRLRRYSRRKS